MIYVFDEFEMDTRQFELRQAGEPRHVEPQVFNLIAYLLRHRERVVDKEELLREIWHGRNVSDATLSSRLKAARKALKDDGQAQRVIATFPRRGYRFVAAARELAPDATLEAATAAAPLPGDAALAPKLKADRVALAVIPFASPPVRPKIAWLADTLATDISTRLARIPGFVVISRNSCAYYKDREVGLRQIGQELGVGYLVLGSLWDSGEQLRVSIQLMEVASGQLLWADQSDIPAADLPRLQADVVREIVSHIEPEILRAELPALRQRDPVNLGAWELYRQAQAQLGVRGWTPESCAEAAVLLRQAIEQSPGLAFAHAYLALVLALGHIMGLLTDDLCLVEAKRAAEQALALDTQDSDVLGYAGCAFADLGDARRGVGLLERAIELDPSNAQAHTALGAVLLKTGKAEGFEHLRYGMQISPRDNRLGVWGAVLARALLSFNRCEEAIAAARAACRYDDKTVLPRIVLALACARVGALDEAAVALADARRIQPRLRLEECRYVAGVREIEELKRLGLV